jgi:ATP-dependent protease ClpP protease subunit
MEKATKILVMQSGDVAEMFIYGVIGDYGSTGDDNDPDCLTDIDFLKTLKSLEPTHPRINIRCNCYGGNMKHGLAMITAIKNCKSEIHIFNDGMMASMAADMFFAVKKEHRHMASNAVLMIHAPSNGVYGTVKDLKEKTPVIIAQLESLTKAAIAVMVEGSNMSADQIEKEYYDFSDHYLTADDCLKKGFVTAIESYAVENMPKEPTKMSHTDWKKYFSDSQAHKTIPGPIEEEESIIFNHNQNHEEMTTQQIVAALADGSLNEAEVLAALGAQKLVKPEPTPDPSVLTADAVTKIITDAIAPLKAQNEGLRTELDAVKLKTVNAGPTFGKAEDVNPDDAKKMLEMANSNYADDNVQFTAGEY